MSDAPLPPWHVYPDIPGDSIGWRMGHPEDVYAEFWDWFISLSDEEAAEYKDKNPEPRSWRGKYAQIRNSRKVNDG